jgi:hypothetical protein
MAASLGISWSNEWIVRQWPSSKDVNTEAEEGTTLEAVTRRQQVEGTADKDLVHAAVNCNVCQR